MLPTHCEDSGPTWVLDSATTGELLSAAVGSITPRQAKAIVAELGGLRAASTADASHIAGVVSGLLKFKGARRVTATRRVVACLRFAAASVAMQAPLPKKPIRTPMDMAEYLRARMGDLTQESFVIVGLDSRQKPMLIRTVHTGTLSEVEVHPREVFGPLLRARAHSVIVSHNHPSGDAAPSESDLSLTRRLVKAGHTMGIPVLDHLVVTRSKVSSLASLGLL